MERTYVLADGIIKPEDWKAKWVASPSAIDSVYTPPVLFRKQFTHSKKIQSATAFITAQGMYEANINGKRVVMLI